MISSLSSKVNCKSDLEAANHEAFHQEEDNMRCDDVGWDCTNYFVTNQFNHKSDSEAPNHEAFHQEEDNVRCDVVGWDCTNYFVTNQVFNSRDELTGWCKQVGKSCGTIVGIKKSDNKKYGRKARINYACERSGQFRDNKKKNIVEPMRRTRTKKCGCPFLLKGVKLPDEDQWKVQVICGRHNHPVEKDPTYEGHAFAGRLSTDEQKVVRDLTICGVKPKEILRVLKQNDPTNASTIETIYNFKAKYRIGEMQGRSQMQHLLQILDERHYVEFHMRNEDTEEVLDIFFAHPYSSQLLKCFPEVLIMDCTYKTNRHGLPLLEICGVTSTGKTFIVAHAYLKQEIEGSYKWALQCLKDIINPFVTPSVIVTDRDLALMNAIYITFPNVAHLLCKWHISKNVEGRGKSVFTTKKEWEVFFDSFHELIRCPTEESFDEELQIIMFKYTEKKHQDLLKYIIDTWFSSYKTRFVCAWTNSIMHFGNVTTNRVESQHAALKKYLGSSQGDLVNNFKMTHNLLISQHVAIRASFQKSLSYNMHDHRISDFNYLRGFVSCYALEMILEEKKRGEYVGIDVSMCGCVLKQTHGLPCAHEIVQWNREGRGIPLSSIHPRWKQLSDISRSIQAKSIDCEREISLVRKRFDSASEEQKCMMLKILLELGNPASTNLEPPSKNNVVRGRPSTSKKKASKKKETSTKRDPSLFEFAKTQEEQQIQLPVKCATTRKRQAKVTRKDSSSKPQSEESCKKTSSKKHKSSMPLKDLTNEQYFDSVLETFDPKIKKFIIERLEDVAPDGHCGYRCCAEFLGLSRDDGWKFVRQRMLVELTLHKGLHIGMLGGEKNYREVEIALDYFDIYGCSKKYWMQFPAMGCLFATAFNCALCVLSPKQYITYLPLRLGPVDEIKIVQMVLYNDNHFLKFYWKEGAPIPPIIPGWRNHRYPDASVWEHIIFDRIYEWKNLIGYPLMEPPSLEDNLLSALKVLTDTS